MSYKVPIFEKFVWQDPSEDKDLSTPPISPAKGQRYIVKATATGAWVGEENNIALCVNATGPTWEFITAREGMTCWVKDENNFYKFDGSSWIESIGAQGPQGYQGNQGYQGYQGSTPSDYVKNNGTVNPTNLLSNGDFDVWSAGTSADPDGWTFSGAGASIAREGTIKKLGAYSAKITRAGTDCSVYQAIQDIRGINYWKGRTVTFGCWVYATVANRACLQIGDGVAAPISSYHSGNSTWEFLTLTLTISSSATELIINCLVINGATSAYFDGAMCVEGESAFAFSDKPAGEGTWKDYSGVSTIVGWSSFTVKVIYVKKIGKTVFVSFRFYGTSNSTSISFTLPYTSFNDANLYLYGLTGTTVDNGSYVVNHGMWTIAPNSSTVNVYTSTSAGAWTNSGDKVIYGSLCFESA